MSRTLDAAFITELTSDLVYPALLYEGQFTGLTVRLWTGLYDLSWDSQTWNGNGWLHGVSLPADTAEIRSQSMTVRLSGVPATLISLVLSDADQQHDGKLWFAYLDSSDRTMVVDDPVLMFTGRLDVPVIKYDAELPTLDITYESRLVDLDRARILRYSDEGQQLLYSGDRGFEYMTFINQWRGFWGKERADLDTGE